MNHTASPDLTHLSEPLRRIGDVDVETFMKTDWHRNARLFRQAIPGFQPVCSIDELLGLATDPEAEARLIENQSGQWSLTHGPLDALPPRTQPAWTVLVQGLNLMSEAAQSLLNRFRFVPEARLDDLMVSFATDGGGVGPHFDSYDVFLLQMHGQRRWRISAQTDLTLCDGLPLKILRDFQPEQEFVLNPGDMLYLPPRYAHDGVAVGDCTTLSIGFRAPTAAELLSSVLRQMADDVFQDASLGSARFSDPLRGMTETPGALPDDLLSWVGQHLQGLQPQAAQIEKGLLIERTEPKPHVLFNPPARAPRKQAVKRMLTERGIRLARASRLIYGENGFAINGEWFALFTTDTDRERLKHLADKRQLRPGDCANADINEAFIDWCTAMVDAGWIEPCEN